MSKINKLNKASVVKCRMVLNDQDFASLTRGKSVKGRFKVNGEQVEIEIYLLDIGWNMMKEIIKDHERGQFSIDMMNFKDEALKEYGRK